ncbi:putative terminase ATPase subunit [Bacillus phage PBC2]|uniref:Putative terminase ATPase subunit n=1 Tax=Bacillus phage PBC2 TaxID=1675029 RepID=A0A218KCC8_9CAUD|nr:putative terminase ATPase subunit [Bacillus phage PBC2]AKQ08538.1 putative terminase ATPase subunit [Bacillus phage PBC2]
MTNQNKGISSYDQVKEEFRKALSFFREYPDYFIDYIRTENTRFRLTPFQRVFLRAFFRNKKVGIVASRGISKTYIDVMAHYLKCIMYPNSSICLAMPTKTQSAKVVEEKVEELWTDYPLLKNEVIFEKCKFQKDYVRLVFRNGSSLDTLTVGESSRGLRANSIALEEIVDEKMDRDTINNVILPILAQPRMTKHGADPNEYSKTQAYITTASHRQSYCYEKYMELFNEMVDGKPTIVLGSSYEMGARFGTLDIDDVTEKINSATYSPLSFAREYQSIFTGSSEKSLVTIEDINKCRTEKKPEYRADKKSKDAMYVLSYDIARAEGKQTANSSLAVFKCLPRGDGTYQKFLVNMFTMAGTHFHEQAKFLKQKVAEYNASILVLDHNGIGRAVTDILVTDMNDGHPPYSVINDDRYDKYKLHNSIPILYLISAQSKETHNSDIVNVFMASIANKDVFILKSESNMRGEIKEKDNILLGEKLLPFVQVDRMVDEIMNLEYVQSGNRTSVKQISRSVEKDRYSAFAYGLFYLYLLEKKNKERQRETYDATGFFAVKKANYRIKSWS